MATITFKEYDGYFDNVAEVKKMHADKEKKRRADAKAKRKALAAKAKKKK